MTKKEKQTRIAFIKEEMCYYRRSREASIFLQGARLRPFRWA